VCLAGRYSQRGRSCACICFDQTHRRPWRTDPEGVVRHSWRASSTRHKRGCQGLRASHHRLLLLDDPCGDGVHVLHLSSAGGANRVGSERSDARIWLGTPIHSRWPVVRRASRFLRTMTSFAGPADCLRDQRALSSRSPSRSAAGTEGIHSNGPSLPRRGESMSPSNTAELLTPPVPLRRLGASRLTRP